MLLKKYCFNISSYNQALEILKICKGKKIKPVFFIKFNLINGLGVIWLKQLEKMLQKSIEKKITKSNDNLVMAFSGGIDSTLVLSLIKKILPNQNIKALSIQFADSVDETKTAKKIADELYVPHKTIFLETFLCKITKDT